MTRKLLQIPAMILCILLLSVKAEAAKVSVEATVPVPPAVEITNVSYWPVPYDPTVGYVTISFSLSKPASVSLRISDMFDSFVNLLAPFLVLQVLMFFSGMEKILPGVWLNPPGISIPSTLPMV